MISSDRRNERVKMAMKNGVILIKEADSQQFAIIKSWGKMKWSKADQTLKGPADHELLNKLATIVRLPAEIEAERQRQIKIIKAIDKERLNEDPKPLVKYPVKMKLFKHQVRGANMAMLVFGLVEPLGEKPKKTEGKDESDK